MSDVLLQISLQNIIFSSFFLVSKLPYDRGHDDVIYIVYMYVIIELLYYILNLLVSSKLSFIAATMMLYICHNRVALLHIKSASIVKTIIHRGHDDAIYMS